MGAVVGLVVGVLAYPPTAAFAVVEIAVPGAVIGAVLACLITLPVLCRRSGENGRTTR